MTEHKFVDMKSQNGISSWGGRRKLPSSSIIRIRIGFISS
ncbi:hypothetical protein [Pedobacter foliorum]